MEKYYICYFTLLDFKYTKKAQNLIFYIDTITRYGVITIIVFNVYCVYSMCNVYINV